MTDESQHWTQAAVSWSHLLLSLCGVLLVVGGVVVANEQRITRLEVRQAQVIEDNKAQDERYYRTVANRNAEYQSLRNDMNARLDRMEVELTAIKIAVSAHAAQAQRDKALR